MCTNSAQTLNNSRSLLEEYYTLFSTLGKEILYVLEELEYSNGMEYREDESRFTSYSDFVFSLGERFLTEMKVNVLCLA